MDTTTIDAPGNPERFASKVWRYLFPRRLLQLPRGDVYLQHSMLRENREAIRRWSMHYLQVHGVLMAAIAGASMAAMQVSSLLAAATGFAAVLEMMCVIVLASLAIAVRLE
jgi:uncharacterized paraquat-inducible protein A